MNHLLVLVLAFFLAVSVFVGAFLYWKLRGKTAELMNADILSDSFPTAATDQYLYDRCCRYMTERRPFLVASFSLQDLANAVYTNKAYLSKTINRYSGKNFRQYINYYRVMYAMELFRKNMGLRVIDMASLSGFRSQTVFLRSFKVVMGEQPGAWCSRMRKKCNKNL